MAKAGFEYTPPPLADLYQGIEHMATPAEFTALAPISPIPSVESGLGVTASTALSVAARLAQDAARNPGFDSLTSTQERAAYSAAGETCQPDPTTYVGLGDSAAPDALLNAFNDMAEQANSASAVRSALDGYRSCMRSQGIAAEDLETLRQMVPLRLNEAGAEHGDGTEPFGPSSPGWADVVRFEQSAAAADASCRTEAHAVGMAALEALLSAFVTDHADELGRSRAVWQRLSEQAAAARPRLRSLDPTARV